MPHGLFTSVLVHVKVTPDSREESIARGKKENYFEVHLREPAMHNRANDRLVEMIKEFYPDATLVRIIRGHMAPKKILEIFFGK